MYQVTTVKASSGHSVDKILIQLESLTWHRCLKIKRRRHRWEYYTNNTPNVRHISWCFRSQFIFAGRDPKNLIATATVENSTQWQRTQLSACMVQSQILNTMVRPQLLWFFQNLPNSLPISSGHNVIHTPAPFSISGLLWQWWLSYPLRATAPIDYTPEL